MSTISDYVIFLLKAPYLLTTRFSLLAKAIVATLILVAVVLFPFISKPENLEIPPFDSNYFIYSLVLSICILIVSTLWLEFARKIGFEKPILNPNYDYATPTDIMNNLREDDKNSLMFGRSNNPTEPFTQNSGKSETLRGYMNSSTMGEQYGTFTGMTLYGGPEMYHQTDILKVFPKYNKYKTRENIDLREVSQDIKDKIKEIKNSSGIEENKRLREELIELVRDKDESMDIPKLVARCIDKGGNVNESDEYCQQFTV